MSEQIAIGILLGAAVLLVLASMVGMLAMRDVYQRVHYITPIAVVAPLLVAVAVTLREGWDQNTGATWLAVGFVVLVSPFLSHATLRAARIREQGDWRGRRSAGGKAGEQADAGAPR